MNRPNVPIPSHQPSKLTVEQMTDNPVREFLRAKVKSGSLPSRSNFYIHKGPNKAKGGLSESNTNNIKKANSMHNYAGGQAASGGYIARFQNQVSKRTTPFNSRSPINILPEYQQR